MRETTISVIKFFVDLTLVVASIAIMVYLLLAPTYMLLDISHWIDILIGVLLFALNFFLAIAGVKEVIGRDKSTDSIPELSLAALMVWLLTTIVFLIGVGAGQFINLVIIFGWAWYTFLWWFYSRPFIVKE